MSKTLFFPWTKIIFLTNRLSIFQSAAVQINTFLEDMSPGIIKNSLKVIAREFFLSFHESLFENHTVYEILWGYEERSLKKMQKLLQPFGIKINAVVGIFNGVGTCGIIK